MFQHTFNDNERIEKKKPRENSYFVPRKSALENPKSVRKEERKKKIGEKKRER